MLVGISVERCCCCCCWAARFRWAAAFFLATILRLYMVSSFELEVYGVMNWSGTAVVLQRKNAAGLLAIIWLLESRSRLDEVRQLADSDSLHLATLADSNGHLNPHGYPYNASDCLLLVTAANASEACWKAGCHRHWQTARWTDTRKHAHSRQENVE